MTKDQYEDKFWELAYNFTDAKDVYYNYIGRDKKKELELKTHMENELEKFKKFQTEKIGTVL